MKTLYLSSANCGDAFLMELYIAVHHPRLINYHDTFSYGSKFELKKHQGSFTGIINGDDVIYKL
jgi:hypothetical protein